MKKNQILDKFVQKSSKNMSHKSADYEWLIGIDEVGRGPLAGPVSVGLFAVNIVKLSKVVVKKVTEGLVKNLINNLVKELVGKNINSKIKITDSKKISHEDRVRTYEFFHKNLKANSHLFHFDVMHKSAKEIDKKGIAVCISQLVDVQIVKFSRKIKSNKIYAFLDGGLKTPKCDFKTVIKGDLKIPIIGAASIMAKFTRDKLMMNLAKKYPNYGLEIHKGYGTKKHIENIRKFGVSDLHRRTFLSRIELYY